MNQNRQYGSVLPSFKIPAINFKEKKLIYPPLFSLVVVIALNAYLFSFNHKIYPGVKVASISLSGLTPEASYLLLEQASQGLNTLTLDNGQKIPLTDLGIEYDLKATVDEAYLRGREDNPLLSLRNNFLNLTTGVDLPVVLKVDQIKLDQALKTLAKSIDQPATDASITLNKGVIAVSSSHEGMVLDQTWVKNQILESLRHLQKNNIVLIKRKVEPKVTEAQAQKAKTETEQILSAPVKVKFNDKTWVIQNDQALKLLSFEATSSATPQGSSPYELKVSISSEGIASFVSNLAKEINQPGTDARIEYTNGQITSLVPEQEGRQVDLIEARRRIEVALRSNNKLVDLPVSVTKPAVTLAVINNLGIRDLLGSGKSRFAGSGADRIYNLSLSSQKLHGVLVPSGETFSMYKAVGDVESYTGYREAYIIIDGQTKVGVGGGVCQVSTTLFRAILNAGLPIEERHPHAYRVGYYEQDNPAGIDASVYFPTSDFKFKNDTAGYVLIQRKLDLATSTLTFEIYGQSDGRKATISRPIVSNFVKPPAPAYREDATLAKGTTKQIDFEAWGANSIFERTITKADGTSTSEKFYTHYQPWQAVYLLGTKE